MKLLVENGANINNVDNFGDTPLILAIDSGDYLKAVKNCYTQNHLVDSSANYFRFKVLIRLQSSSFGKGPMSTLWEISVEPL